MNRSMQHMRNRAKYIREYGASSLCGAQVPMFIVRASDIPLDGSNPLLLYGYGGFNIPMTPRYSPRTAAWLKLGGIYAVACLRGGGEFGIDWYEAGTKERKRQKDGEGWAWFVKNPKTGEWEREKEKVGVGAGGAL